MKKRRFGRKALGQRTAHQKIPRVGDQGDDGHLQIGSLGGDQRKGRILPRRGVVQKAGPKALHRRQARIPGRNAQ